jgi:hypothetical protein
MNRKIKFLALFATTILALCVASIPSSAQNSNTPKKEILVGRVLAEIQRPYGAGVGTLWQFFIFGVESENKGDKIKPVLVAYLFHNYKLDPPLREPFFDHSKLYALAVVRESKCDESVSTLSIVENETETGKPLPPSPGIWFVEGAPKDILRSEVDLPCYVFSRGDYRDK